MAKATNEMTTTTTNLIEAVFEAVTRSESWKGASVRYQNGEFSAEPECGRVGVGGVVMNVASLEDFWGSESGDGLMEYLTESSADLIAEVNDIIEEHWME